MKKTFFLFFVLMLFSFSAAFPQLLVENFNYPAGDTLLNHGWNITGTSTTNTITIVSPGLSYPGYDLSGVGNAILMATTGQDVNKKLSSNVTSGPVYVSFMINVVSAQAVGDYFLHLGDFYARTFVRLTSNGNLAFGINKFSVDAGAAITYGDSIYTVGTTYLLVLKYTFNPDSINDDVINLFINPTPNSTEPSPNLTVTTWQDDADSIDMVSLRQGSASNACSAIIDGIRIANTWTDAVVPVELVSFSADVLNASVQLRWSTATEINNRGFEIERSSDNEKFYIIGFVTGNGTTTETRSYSFSDNDLNGVSKYSYRLKQVDLDGSYSYSKVVNVSINNPGNYSLAQNYPNPFNPSTTFSFNLPVDSKVTIKIFDALGREVYQLLNDNLAVGTYNYTVNLSNLSSGIYFYRMEATGIDGSLFNASKMMTLMK